MRALLIGTLTGFSLGTLAMNLAQKADASALPHYVTAHEWSTTQATALVGLGCGPEKLTLIAREEDEFGMTCASIEPLTLDKD